MTAPACPHCGQTMPAPASPPSDPPPAHRDSLPPHVLAYIAARAESLQEAVNSSTRIVRRARALDRMETNFLSRCTPPILLAQCTSDNIRDYLIFMELNGNTQYHGLGCPHAASAMAGNRVVDRCDPSHCPDYFSCPHGSDASFDASICPVRASPDSLDTTLSTLRNGFRALGLSPNPADHSLLRTHIDAVRADSVASLVAPVQATPVFPPLVTRVAQHFESLYLAFARVRSIAHPYRPLRCLLLRALILLCSENGKRPGDTLRIVPAACLNSPDGTAVVIAMHHHKTRSKTKAVIRYVVARNTSHPNRCVLTALEDIKREALNVGWSIASSPWLFPVVDPDGFELTSHTSMPLSMANDAFATALQLIGGPANTTLQGCRIARSVSCRLEEGPLENTQLTGGWVSKTMVERYSALAVTVRHNAGLVDVDDILTCWIRAGVQSAFFRTPPL